MTGFTRNDMLVLRIPHQTFTSDSRVIVTLWVECASLAMIGHPSSDDFTIKIPYG